MFCTGGIRCEKSTSFLRQQGFENVYHLKGGILKYLETTPEEESLWKGECYVFDQRTAVTHSLSKGSYDFCGGCRIPLRDEDKQSPDFKQGIHCPKCIGKVSEKHLQRVEARQKQIDLAIQRKTEHLGSSRMLKKLKEEAS